MASFVRRGRIWTARIHEGGKEVWRSLGTGDRQEAERKARELECIMKGNRWVRRELDEVITRAGREVQGDEAGLLCETLVDCLLRFLDRVPTDRRDALALEFSKRLVNQQSRKIALKDGWDHWEKSSNRSSQAKARTMAGYSAVWRQFVDWAGKRGVCFLHEFDEAAACAYADHLWAVPVSPRTFTAHVQFLRGMWNVLRVPAGMIGPNPWACIRGKQAAPDSGRRDLTPDEVRKIIATAEGAMRLLFIAGAMTAARLGDIVNMKWSELDLDAGVWSFTPAKTSRTGKQLVLPVLEPMLGELRATKAASHGQCVFQEERTLWERGDLNKRISAHFEACGIATNEAIAEGQQRRRRRIVVGFHSLRHSAATAAAKDGVNLALVQKTLGHSTAGMTAHYTHGDLESARKVMAPLAAILSNSQPPSSVAGG